MRAWQRRWETWAGWNLGLERWDLLLAQGKPGVFPEATMPCPILRRNLPTAIRLIGTHFPRRARSRRARAIDKFMHANDVALHF
jgi:hypothetical protein